MKSFLKVVNPYSATFGINCGVSPGYGVKYPDYIERAEDITADCPEAAYAIAMNLAKQFAEDYLSSPEDNKTSVRLLSLEGIKGKVAFDTKKAVVQRTTLEHLLISMEQC